MESSIQRQLWETASGLSAGIGLGLCYELMKPLFHRRHRILRLGAELTYVLIAFAWVFLAGQMGGRGTPPLYLLVCAAGWLLIHRLLALLRRGFGEKIASDERLKTQDRKEKPDLTRKIQKKHRKKFQEGTMQNEKNTL